MWPRVSGADRLLAGVISCLMRELAAARLGRTARLMKELVVQSTSPKPADLAREARDLIERVNRSVLDDPEAFTAPRILATTRALTELTGRLRQAFGRPAAVLEMWAREGVIRMDSLDDPDVAVPPVAEDLRSAAAAAQDLADLLARPSEILWSMSHQDCRTRTAQPLRSPVPSAQRLAHRPCACH